ncbi:phosphotransferase family protein [Actinokineospora xionganensis]|uniref:Phosphotransferase n=1 Tax=Actinokineospora xionganensis TaxID=2684470 RepID=A0ABR7LFS8_9PSEU|nr:phosphotransferase [Actinokineospora xionganensis]MBC6451574.1 phosphotransferase [Actinokineospora xionganensis]
MNDNEWPDDDTAPVIASAALGRDPGPLATAESGSHKVYLGSDFVLKIAAGHSRLDREIALAPHLPAGITAPLLSSGLHLGERDVRYACYARVPGTAPGMGIPGVDGPTARLLAEQAVQRLQTLHAWTPAAEAAETLAGVVDHGGFTGHDALADEIGKLVVLDTGGVIPGLVLDGLREIVDRAPLHASATVPIHADCHWGNWLAHDRRVTALLDFEWARFGDPIDDWFFLARFSGPHLEAVLDVIARATATPSKTLRAECELREAAYLSSDLRAALEHSGSQAPMAVERLRNLDELIVKRLWWGNAQ